MVEKLPFNEEIVDEWYIRTFSEGLGEEELKWHWDDEDRLVEPLHENNWMVQIDDELPKVFDKSIFIPKGVLHRVIKGNGDLKLRIKKFK